MYDFTMKYKGLNDILMHGTVQHIPKIGEHVVCDSWKLEKERKLVVVDIIHKFSWFANNSEVVIIIEDEVNYTERKNQYKGTRFD